MYKPPQNCNRVKSIKSKFENIENQKEQCSSRNLLSKNASQVVEQVLKKKADPLTENLRNNNQVTESEDKCSDTHQPLSRQLSDPLKRNIKRTPAFRVDKNSEKVCGFQRNGYNRSTLFENKVKQFNIVKSGDANSENVNGFCEASVSKDSGESSIIDSSQSTNQICDVSVVAPKSNTSFLYSHISPIKNKNLSSSLLTDIPANSSFEFINSDNLYKTDIQCSKRANKKPLLIKSKSSHDFKSLCSKFNKETRISTKDIDKLPPQDIGASKTTPLSLNENFRTNTEKALLKNNMLPLECNELDKVCDETEESSALKDVDLSLLYTEPIPKSLRHKNPSESSGSNNESPLFQPKIDNIYTKSTLQLTDSDKKQFLESLAQVLQQQDGLTDTLKVALKKPLPGGPAPKKPPRTFQHCVDAVLASNVQKNPCFMQIAKEVEKKLTLEKKNGGKKNGKKNDPKYMLNKLEMALKNNKLRARKQAKVEVSTTSGEDSDDSLLFRSKSCRSLPKPPPKGEDVKTDIPTTFTSASDSILRDFNCFTTFGCTNPAYERIKEPNSLFFVRGEADPIYAEPLQNRNNNQEDRRKSNRNSLYYMSTAVVGEDKGQGVVNLASTGLTQEREQKMDDPKFENGCLIKQLSAENSSLSSFTSDLDSNPSPVADDPHAKIRFLIDNFENKRQTLPKVQKSERDRQERIYGPTSNSNRVEILKNSLKMTLDRTFDSDVGLSSPKESDTEIAEDGKVARMVARFHTFQKSAPRYQQPNVNKETLFSCCLVIERVCDCARIKFKFPPDVESPQDIERLCFPENPDSPPLEGTSAAQTYSLVMTSATGDRTFGYCRRVLPEGSTHCLPLAYCILSKYRAPRFYKRLLIELESRHGMQNKHRDELISQFYYKKFPRPGESITINLTPIESPRLMHDNSVNVRERFEESLDLTSYVHVNKTGEYGTLNTAKRTAIFVSGSDVEDRCMTPSYVAYEGNKTELVLTLHPDTRYEDADLKRLHKLPSDILLKIFSSLLLERKVILISSAMSELSSCVDSLQSILYPFTWYHTFIPILPESLWDIVESPTPVVCGVLSEEAIEDRFIENGIVVNLDTKTVLHEENDEMSILSGSLQKVWRQFITLANNTKSREYVYSVYLADAYLYVLICCFKNYKQFIVDGKFMKEEFIKSAKTKGIRRFLKMFTETCMFAAFIDTALNSPDVLIPFDKKIDLYGSDESRIILHKLIDWNR